MKQLTQEEINAHYRETLKGGTIGAAGGIVAGTVAVKLASIRWPIFRSLTVPMKAFLATSVSTFGAVIMADRYSRGYEFVRRPEAVQQKTTSQLLQEQLDAQKSESERMFDWFRKNRYSVVFASWLASMGIAFSLVQRNPYLTSAQKVVQSRVYAQGLTVAVLVGSFAVEALDPKLKKPQSRWETVWVPDPNDPTKMIEKKIHHERYAGEDMWMDIIEADEKRMREAKAKADGAAPGQESS